ncbi:MAG: tetratricopeptide repeat protein [Candidatus Omnitrophota bacterium]|nr:tetratricopeptide repeat protein [Candidatus Omnitrophota bacterium]
MPVLTKGYVSEKTTRRLSELRRCALSVQHPALYHNKGWLLNLMGRHREALLCFKKALELDERRPEALFSLADSYEALGDRTRARYYFDRALKLLSGRCAYMYRETRKRIAKLKKNSSRVVGPL